MTLPANPKIGDIITELQDLNLINQKAEMAGVVGAPTTSTSNNQDFVETIQDAKDIIATKTGQDNTLGLIEMANGIVNGKKWVSGNVTSTSNSVSFTFANGSGSTNQRKVEVFGLNLDFTPSRIEITGTTSDAITIYRNNGYVYPKIALMSPSTVASSATTSVAVKGDDDSAIVSNDGFVLPYALAEQFCNWIAYE